ncbi:hypothetical protein GCM10019991_00960 [Enterococcus casseliflavus]
MSTLINSTHLNPQKLDCLYEWIKHNPLFVPNCIDKEQRIKDPFGNFPTGLLFFWNDMIYYVQLFKNV